MPEYEHRAVGKHLPRSVRLLVLLQIFLLLADLEVLTVDVVHWIGRDRHMKRQTSGILPRRAMTRTGYEGRFSRRGGDGDGDVDGVAVEARLAGPGGVL